MDSVEYVPQQQAMYEAARIAERNVELLERLEGKEMIMLNDVGNFGVCDYCDNIIEFEEDLVVPWAAQECDIEYHVDCFEEYTAKEARYWRTARTTVVDEQDAYGNTPKNSSYIERVIDAADNKE